MVETIESIPKVHWDFEGIHYFDNGPLTVQYLFVLDALNFCFWPGKIYLPFFFFWPGLFSPNLYGSLYYLPTVSLPLHFCFRYAIFSLQLFLLGRFSILCV